MKMIKIKLNNGSEYIVDEYKFNKIIASQTQIIQLTDWNGTISGNGFNKAYITEFCVDEAETRRVQGCINTFNRLKERGLLERLKEEKPDEYAIGNYYEKNNNKMTTYGN